MRSRGRGRQVWTGQKAKVGPMESTWSMIRQWEKEKRRQISIAFHPRSSSPDLLPIYEESSSLLLPLLFHCWPPPPPTTNRKKERSIFLFIFFILLSICVWSLVCCSCIDATIVCIWTRQTGWFSLLMVCRLCVRLFDREEEEEEEEATNQPTGNERREESVTRSFGWMSYAICSSAQLSLPPFSLSLFLSCVWLCVCVCVLLPSAGIIV